jgi:hypothetical protein
MYDYFQEKYVLQSHFSRVLNIVYDYRLDDRVLSPAEKKNFSFSLCVQTSSEAHPASYPVNTGGPFPGVKRGWGLMLITHPL